MQASIGGGGGGAKDIHKYTMIYRKINAREIEICVVKMAVEYESFIQNASKKK